MITLNSVAIWWLSFYPIQDSQKLIPTGCLPAFRGILIKIIVPIMKAFLNH